MCVFYRIVKKKPPADFVSGDTSRLLTPPGFFSWQPNVTNPAARVPPTPTPTQQSICSVQSDSSQTGSDQRLFRIHPEHQRSAKGWPRTPRSPPQKQLTQQEREWFGLKRNYTYINNTNTYTNSMRFSYFCYFPD